MRLLVCGGRDFKDSHMAFAIISDTLQWYDVSYDCPHTIISGCARGADQIALDWAEAYGVPVDPYPADWNKYPKAAGPIRNQRMIDEGKPDMVLAFPGGKGTADMIKRAGKAGITVLEVELENPSN